jgi:2'-5' RNA ligase
MSAPHYALWLLLPPAERARFAELIRTLAQRHGTPSFEPHITLLGGIGGAQATVVAATAALAHRIAPLHIRLGEIGQRESYFQCLFVHAVLDPPLLQAHRLAREEFARRDDAEFLPHLSLVYGNLEQAQKTAIIAQLGAGLESDFLAEELALICYRKDDQPRDWRRVAAFAFRGDAAELTPP